MIGPAALHPNLPQTGALLFLKRQCNNVTYHAVHTMAGMLHHNLTDAAAAMNASNTSKLEVQQQRAR
jgi:hypothetical protein